MIDNLKTTSLVCLWVAYVAAMGFIGYDLYLGDPYGLLKNYVFGTAGLWAGAGVMLWHATFSQ